MGAFLSGSAMTPSRDASAAIAAAFFSLVFDEVPDAVHVLGANGELVRNPLWESYAFFNGVERDFCVCNDLSKVTPTHVAGVHDPTVSPSGLMGVPKVVAYILHVRGHGGDLVFHPFRQTASAPFEQVEDLLCVKTDLPEILFGHVVWVLVMHYLSSNLRP